MNLFNMLLTTTKKESTNKPLTFTAEADNSNVVIRTTGTVDYSGIQYRLNEADGWTPYTPKTFYLYNKGDYVQFQNTNETFSLDSTNYFRFVLNGMVKASGNIQSMLNYIDNVPANSFINMFSGCSKLTQAPELPATTLAERCYSQMFVRCTGLTKAPKLPATTLAERCYYQMFYGCTGFTETPKLQATTLANNCYSGMFNACTGLTEAPVLPATTLANNCYSGMFFGCTGLTEAPKLPATTLANNCYNQMFYGCTGLTEAPVLPATTLANNCYYSMFQGCSSLTKALELPATTLADSCYYCMFKNCSKLNEVKVHFTDWNVSNSTTNWLEGTNTEGTFTCPTALPVERGVSRIPEGWTVVNF